MPTTPAIQSRVTSSSSIVAFSVQSLKDTGQQFSNHDNRDDQGQAFKEYFQEHSLPHHGRAGLLCAGVSLQVSRLTPNQQVAYQKDEQCHRNGDK